MGRLGLTPSEFWKCTFTEIQAICDGRFGKKVEKPLSIKDVREWERNLERLRNGGSRKPSSQA